MTAEPLLLTSKRLHFLNSNHNNRRTFSCATDCFLELSSSVLFPYLQHTDRSDFFDTLYNACLQYREQVFSYRIDQVIPSTDFLRLQMVREPVWELLREKCQSFSSMDCNAQFSEIFTLHTFGSVKEFEKKIFITKYNFQSYCTDCRRTFSKSVEIFVNYVRYYDVFSSGYNRFNWTDFMIQRNLEVDSIQCNFCSREMSESNLISVEYAKLLVVELAIDSIGIINFIEKIYRTNTQELLYELEGIVRYRMGHFTCAIKINEKWLYIDDIQHIQL